MCGLLPRLKGRRSGKAIEGYEVDSVAGHIADLLQLVPGATCKEVHEF